MSGTEGGGGGNNVEENCVKSRQMISKNIQNTLNGIELQVNEDALQHRDDKIRKGTSLGTEIYRSISSSSLVFSPKAGFGRNQSPVRRPVWLWHTAL